MFMVRSFLSKEEMLPFIVNSSGSMVLSFMRLFYIFPSTKQTSDNRV